ncbi:sodium channel protein 60E, partial [Halyomorpha halys]|uniref:sodium channel protein 60E n=1 Tax=Halyomorpha halys TaxID=286706 RepID=UPI0006D4CA37
MQELAPSAAALYISESYVPCLSSQPVWTLFSVNCSRVQESLQNLDKNLPSGLNIEVKEKETEQPTGIKCNGVNGKKTENISVYTLPQERTQIVTIDDLQDRNCDGCVDCCINYHGWLRIQNSLYRIVRDPLFELLITLCILLNTLFLAMEHHGMSQNVKSALDIGNKVFTSIFTLECTMKLLALSKEFFNCGWNIFDLIIVSVSLLDLSFELVDGLSVLRCLRLLRVLKLAQSWTTMKVLLSIIISTLGALGNLTFVLVIIIYIFAVIGMQLFSRDYTPERFDPDPVPRWNFSDFFHSFMMIFRILCGEWIEPLWDCMRAEKHEGAGTCFAIFLPALVMGNFMVLNLFLALLLNSFNSEELKSKKEPDSVVEDAEVAEMKRLLSDHVRVASRFCHRCSHPQPSNSPSPISPLPRLAVIKITE